jgi:hypothetical protein
MACNTCEKLLSMPGSRSPDDDPFDDEEPMRVYRCQSCHQTWWCYNTSFGLWKKSTEEEVRAAASGNWVSI